MRIQYIALIYFVILFLAYWYVGTIAACVVLSLPVGLFVYGEFNGWQESRVRRMLDRDGKLVKAWIVFANENLDTPQEYHSAWPAQVVFTVDRKGPGLSEYLEDLAAKVRDFELEEGDGEEARRIAAVVETEKADYDPLLIPARLTGDCEAFTVSVIVRVELLPSRYLHLPYVKCRVMVDQGTRRRYARMVAYPKKDVPKRPSLGPMTWEDKERAEEE